MHLLRSVLVALYRTALLSFASLVALLLYYQYYPVPHLVRSDFVFPDKDIPPLPSSARYVDVQTAPSITLKVIYATNSKVPPNNETIIFLHGFPETAHVTWSLQIAHFADLGYQVIAPDQRGYNQSSKPVAIADYDIDLLTADIVALIKQYSPNKKVFVVGHDWGAFITWTIAQQYPELIEKIFIMNVPHFAALQDAIFDLTTLQLFKSYYIFYFQLPYLPELRMLDDNSSKFYKVGNMKYAAQKGNIGLPFLNTLRSSWLVPGAPTGMINWYRALIRKTIFGNVEPLMAPIHVPTYILWGYNDYYLHEVTARKSMDYLAAEVKNQSKLVYLYDVEHFLIHQVPDIVNEHISKWIAH